VSLAAGRLRHRLRLEKRDSDQDSVTGAPSFTWVEVARPWGAVEPLSVKDFINSKAQQSEVTGRIVIRFRDDINPQMRFIQTVRGREKIFKVVGILPDPESGTEFMTIAVSEGVSEG
jgi:SPP1 family predicted phage head-tail adaptor